MTINQGLEIAISLGIVLSNIVCWSALIALYLTLDRRLKIVIRDSMDLELQRPALLRVINVALCTAIKNRSSQNRYMMYYYKGFDFNRFTTRFEKSLSYTLLSSGFLLFFLVVSAVVTNLIGLTAFELFEPSH